MSASRDWIGMETAISALLPEARGMSARRELLASLDGYATAATRDARALDALAPSADECAGALEWLLRPVFVCGHHRSGTTLLQSLLDGHPRLLVVPSEGTYFTSFAYAARAASSSAALDRFAAEWIMRFIDPNFAPHFRLGRSDAERIPAVEFARRLFGWHAALRSRVAPEFAALLALAAAFRATTAPASDPLLWVEKTPQNERYASRFARLAGARFIQLVRDPRATLASLREAYRANGIAGFDTAEQAHAIGRSLRLAVENRRRWGDRYLVVRYEDLVARSEREVERVTKFLGIAPDAALLSPTAGGNAVRANTSFGSGSVGVIERPRQVAALPAEDAALLGAYAASAARAFDYTIPTPSMMARVVLRARHSPRQVLRLGRAALHVVTPSISRRLVDRSR
jgi:hypothetical protein